MRNSMVSLHRLQVVVDIVMSFSRNLVFEFFDKGCQKSAAALTYMTLFALVPMMTVTYSMFSMIPSFDGVAEQLQSLIFENFLPATGSDVHAYLSDFSSQARNLTGFGIGMLVVTAYLMLTNIEKTFNDIWGVTEARRGLSSFLLYWAVLSIGPLLLGAGLVISTYVLSVKMIVQEYDQIGLTSTIFAYVPIFMTSIAFTLLFVAVPNCRVPLRIAAIGGVVTALCFELLKVAFGALVANSSFKLIYGAFAVVPLFLLWINFLWMIVLAGAVFVRTLSEHAYAKSNRHFSDIRAALHCLSMFRDKSQLGHVVSDRDCANIGVSLVHWQSLRSLLTNNKWIAVTQSGGYVLSRDLNSLTLWDLQRLVQMPLDETKPNEEEVDLEGVDSEAVNSETGDVKTGDLKTADLKTNPIDDPREVWLREYLLRTQAVFTFTSHQFDMTLEALFALESPVSAD